MPGTYTQLHIQLVFAVRYREALIDNAWKENLHGYIGALLQSRRHKPLKINSMPDHIHILLGLRPYDSISSLTKIIKSESTKWINQEGFTKKKFNWQEGYGAFSYGKSQVPDVIRYIENQETHHRKQTFLQEYQDFLDKFEVEYDERYLFREPE
jgi:REP element-mobilizing transposase RayT